MTAQQLKNSILQLAVQGKLVPQDPNDEPASALLERIRVEKERLIKEGKIKRVVSYQLSVISCQNRDGKRFFERMADGTERDITYEIPFDVPESWKWVRLSNICSSITDGDHQPPPQMSQGIPFLVISNVTHGYIDWSNTRFVPEDYYDKIQSQRKANVGDILFTVTGSYGIPLLVKDERKFCFQRHIALMKPMLSCREYLMILLQSPCVRLQCDYGATGTAQKTVSLSLLRSLLIPLPPLDEQHRIVERIEQLLPHIADYDTAEQKLTALNAKFPDRLKKSILQSAVQGKLVPQDENDEPASVLLERIRAEKEQLIKDGKLKKEKPLPPIAEDEIPFDVPESWEWVRLGSIIQLISGQDMTPDKYFENENGVPYITGASNIENESIIVNRWTSKPRAISIQGDLLITCKGTVGAMAFMNCKKAHIARQIMAVRMGGSLCHVYIKLFLETYVITLKAAAKSMIPGISRDDMLNALVPIPPLTEQRRIVEKCEESFRLIIDLFK